MRIAGLPPVGRWTVLAVLATLFVCLRGTPAHADELAFELGFRNPQDDTELSWLAQPGATDYQLLRSTSRSFSSDCATFETAELFQTDPAEPGAGGVLHYLVRELAPRFGSWGAGSDGAARAPACMAATGSLVGSFGCKVWRGAADASEPPPSQDCIEYDYLGEGELRLRHINTAFNCCPEFVAGIEVEGDTILITETEISGICFCLCLFDLDYEIVNLAPGAYRVTVDQEYLEEGDEPLDFVIDLPSSPSGIHCVERTHYPWW